jgi:hypothetical protein
VNLFHNRVLQHGYFPFLFAIRQILSPAPPLCKRCHARPPSRHWEMAPGTTRASASGNPGVSATAGKMLDRWRSLHSSKTNPWRRKWRRRARWPRCSSNLCPWARSGNPRPGKECSRAELGGRGCAEPLLLPSWALSLQRLAFSRLLAPAPSRSRESPAGKKFPRKDAETAKEDRRSWRANLW